MTEKEQFLAELNVLLRKYSARIEVNTDYDGTDSPCGDTVTVDAPTFSVDLNDLA